MLMVTLSSLDILAVLLFWLFCQLTFTSNFCPRYPVSDEYPLFMPTLLEIGYSDQVLCIIHHCTLPLTGKMYSFHFFKFVHFRDTLIQQFPYVQLAIMAAKQRTQERLNNITMK